MEPPGGRPAQRRCRVGSVIAMTLPLSPGASQGRETPQPCKSPGTSQLSRSCWGDPLRAELGSLQSPDCCLPRTGWRWASSWGLRSPASPRTPPQTPRVRQPQLRCATVVRVVGRQPGHVRRTKLLTYLAMR